MQNFRKNIFFAGLITLALAALPAGSIFADSFNFYNQSFLNQINAVSWTSSKPVVIAVIDQGIDFDHPDLAANKWQGPGGIAGWDFLTNSSASQTHGSHGTEVAGIIKATAGQSSNLQFMSLAVCQDGVGCAGSNIISAIYYAVDHGADIINLSLGTNNYDSAYDPAIAYAYAHNVVVVAAAGNQEPIGRDLSQSPISPVCNDGGSNMVLGVSAVDAGGELASWANYGSCVDVYAPAVNVYTTTDPNWDNGKLYDYADGTSFAAPEATAVAAKIKILHSDYSAAQIISAVINSSTSGTVPVLNLQPNLTMTSLFSGGSTASVQSANTGNPYKYVIR